MIWVAIIALVLGLMYVSSQIGREPTDTEVFYRILDSTDEEIELLEDECPELMSLYNNWLQGDAS